MHNLFFLFIFFPITSIVFLPNRVIILNIDTLVSSQNGRTKERVAFYCPEVGKAKNTQLRKLNTLKNRISFPQEKDFNYSATLQELLKGGNDKERWSSNHAARITGYVKEVKPGSVETANCNAKERELRDTHIELVLNPMSVEKKEVFVVEITPRIRAIMAEQGEDWGTSMIRSQYLGRWVEIEGWLFFDSEHKNRAENTNPNGGNNWRKSAWEIHPVTKIKLADKR